MLSRIEDLRTGQDLVSCPAPEEELISKGVKNGKN